MADDSVLAAGIAAAGQAAAAYMSSKLNYKDSKKLMALQAQYQREQFDYTNDYNNPVNQIIRLKLAGLSPNLMYGHGQSVGNSAGMPQVSANKANFHDYSSVVARSIDALRLVKEQKMVDQQIENMRQQNKELAIKNEILEATKQNALDSSDYNLMLLRSTYERSIAGLDKERAEATLSNIEAFQKEQENDIYRSLLQDGTIRNYLENKYDNVYYQNARLYADIQRTNEEIFKIQKERVKLGHEIDVAAYYARLANAGINPNEPYWGRILGQVATKFANQFGYDGVDDAILDGINKGMQKASGTSGAMKIVRAIAGSLSPGLNILDNVLSND